MWFKEIFCSINQGFFKTQLNSRRSSEGGLDLFNFALNLAFLKLRVKVLWDSSQKASDNPSFGIWDRGECWLGLRLRNLLKWFCNPRRCWIQSCCNSLCILSVSTFPGEVGYFKYKILNYNTTCICEFGDFKWFSDSLMCIALFQ